MIKASMSIRLPLDVKSFIEIEARINSSSQNSEVIRAIRAAMKEKSSAEAATSPSDGSTYSQEGQVNEHADH